MIAYFEERALLGATMSGFRKGHSTTNVLLGIRDALIRASKKGEVTLMVYADYSKAFDTVQFRTVLTKMYGLGFSKSFLHWVINYLTNRQQLVQVNDEKSSLLTIEFGVPQGSVLGPMFFNLYVADLQEKLQLPSYQYADDTSFYFHSKVCDLDSAVQEVNDGIARLVDYSQCSNLALNSSKTDWMLFSTSQMARAHDLGDRTFSIKCGDKLLDRIRCKNLLGVRSNEHLSWSSHIDSLLTSCYGILAVLKKLKNLAPFHVKKTLVESLVLSKIDYASPVFYPLPVYQQKRLQRLQNACAGFVLRKFARQEDLATLNWLSISERMDFSILKLTYKALHDDPFPEYLRLSLHCVNAYRLRSSSAPVLSIPKESGTFQDSAAATFNKLPVEIRNINNYRSFCHCIKEYLKNSE